MAPATLALCLIYKDEERYLEACLESVLPVIDEAVLVDSGSTDRSLQIAQRFASQNPNKFSLLTRAWTGDFSQQRNFALEHVKSDWILFLDADERLHSADFPKLKKAISRNEIEAYLLPIRNYTLDVTEFGYERDLQGPFHHGFVKTSLHRLFRNRRNYRYTGILHERIEPSLEASHAGTENLDVTIHHFGKIKEKELNLTESRYAFYEKLGRAKLAAEPNNAQAHWELGVVLQKQKRFAEAESEFRKAYELKPDVAEFEEYLALILFQQSKWAELKIFEAKHPKAQIFRIVAEAQEDPSAIDKLDAYRMHMSQVSLFLLELSLRHRRKDRLQKDIEEAERNFKNTGIVEFLEGVQFRREGQLDAAAKCLDESVRKGFEQSLGELFIVWNQMGKYADVLKKFETFKEADVHPDILTLVRYAQVKMTERVME